MQGELIVRETDLDISRDTHTFAVSKGAIFLSARWRKTPGAIAIATLENSTDELDSTATIVLVSTFGLIRANPAVEKVRFVQTVVCDMKPQKQQVRVIHVFASIPLDDSD
jgi:hypothetical protein